MQAKEPRARLRLPAKSARVTLERKRSPSQARRSRSARRSSAAVREHSYALLVQRRLRYSERKRLSETGSLGDLGDFPSMELRRALVAVLQRAVNRDQIGFAFETALRQVCAEHFGWEPGVKPATYPLEAADAEELLDFCEIVVEQGAVKHWWHPPTAYSGKRKTVPAFADAEKKFIQLFERHRFGYTFEAGEARKIGSPALDDVVVHPALLAVQQAGWEEVERSFREALHHQRGGADENDDAITAAHSALEAALKAVGAKGNELNQLAKSFRSSSLVLPQLEEVPELLDKLLKRSAAIRNTMSDAHGKSSGAQRVPQALADLAIHWSGAFIVYLAELARHAAATPQANGAPPPEPPPVIGI
jgi:hypothetical protein